ncbi:4Fe-4S dicluster domain-containing protein [Seleniivibrio woodruffii]|uniref:indolepyruvate ferredoxin oxidoreductase subunit alpha n=1 Tax=Seleniivibrio woodruffii TaxID=1078050 RepID=UPI0026F2D723|nr:4Fe-4S dicluster domain-containing protein [Seleniivibrio woodruffii]
MAVEINTDCTKCGICATVCPLGAIAFSEDGCELSQNICNECGACIIACPSGAIVRTGEPAVSAEGRKKVHKNCIGHGGRYKKGSYLSRLAGRL